MDVKQYIASQVQSDKQFSAELQSLYGRSLDEIVRTIESQLVRGGDLRQSDYDAQESEIINQAKQVLADNPMLSYADFENEVKTRMKVYRATSTINHDEFIKSMAGLGALGLGVRVLGKVTNKLTNDTLEAQKHMASMLNTETQKLTKRELYDLVFKGIDGANFSERIWRDTDVLKAQLDELISKQLVGRRSVQEISAELRKRADIIAQNQKYVTDRIVRTESARAESEAMKAEARKNNIQYVKWVAETGACKYCKNIAYSDKYIENEDGVYPIDEVPFLPAHPNCRCSIGPFIPDVD